MTKTATVGGINATISSTEDRVLERQSLAKAKLDGDDFAFVELYKKLSNGRLWVDIYTDNTSGTSNDGAVDVSIGDRVQAGGTIISSGAKTLNGNHNNLAGTFSCPSGCGIVDGLITSGAWTFTPNAGSAGVRITEDNDWLAGGIWIYVPDDATSLVDYEFGAFIDGNNEFEQRKTGGLDWYCEV